MLAHLQYYGCSCKYCGRTKDFAGNERANPFPRGVLRSNSKNRHMLYLIAKYEAYMLIWGGT